MKFWQAMREMQENRKKIRCKDWSSREYFGDDNTSGFSIVYLDSEWEIYQEEKPQKPIPSINELLDRIERLEKKVEYLDERVQ